MTTFWVGVSGLRKETWDNVQRAGALGDMLGMVLILGDTACFFGVSALDAHLHATELVRSLLAATRDTKDYPLIAWFRGYRIMIK